MKCQGWLRSKNRRLLCVILATLSSVLPAVPGQPTIVATDTDIPCSNPPIGSNTSGSNTSGMGNIVSSFLLGTPNSVMPATPAAGIFRTFHIDTALGVYRIEDGKITLEQRKPAILHEGEERLQETLITLMESHSPRVDVGLVFDFPEPIRSLFNRLAHACSNDTVKQVDIIDAEIQSQVRMTFLGDRLLQEPLVCLAIAAGNYPLVKTLVARRPPPSEEETRFLWKWRAHAAEGDAISDPSTTTALLRYRWLKMDDTYAAQIPSISDVAMAIDRIDALLEVGYGFVPTTNDHLQTKYYWLLRKSIAQASVSVLRHLVSQVPIPRRTAMYNDLVTVAAARPEDGDATIGLLLDQGLDVDARTPSWDDASRSTALHVAVHVGSVANTKCLLRRGAKMLQDVEGRTPLQLAQHLHRAGLATVLADALRERGLSSDYEDQDPVNSRV